jgi:hypothetical protein
MRQLVYFVFFLTFFQLKGQVYNCYFQKDTGSVDNETSQSVVELNDGSIYVAGMQAHQPVGNQDAALIKYDACGNVLWIKYYSDSLSMQGLFINKTTDQKLIMVGVVGNSSNYNDIFFSKLDTNGSIIFQKRYHNSLNQSAKYIQQTTDKGFVFCGYISDSFGNNNSYVIKTDSLGNAQWTQEIGTPADEYASSIKETTDGNYIMVGDATDSRTGDVNIEIVKLHKNGTIIWDNIYGDTLNNGSQGIIELSNGKYFCFGETEVYHNSPFNFFTNIIDTNGVDFGMHKFGGTGTDALFSLVETQGMQFICTGYSRSYNGGQPYDMVFFKVDTAGNIKWLKDINSPGIDIGYEVTSSIFGGYLLTGQLAKNNGNYFLARLDTVGNVIMDIDKPVSESNEIAVYPNPTVFDLRVIINNKVIESIFITDLLGKNILEFTFQNKSSDANIDVSYFTPGAYILKIKTQKEVFNRIFFKN